jgi:hypothetical protein
MANAVANEPSPLGALPSPVEWIQIIELGYADDGTANRSNNRMVCFHCGKSPDDADASSSEKLKFLKCARCAVASYCRKECQVQDWKKGGHKSACESYSRVGTNMSIVDEGDKAKARQEIFARIRLYACPYAVHQARKLGRGFLFMQSTQSLATMSLAIPKDSYGHPSAKRSLLLHYLTTGEYDSEVCREDFEMASVRSKLLEAVEKYEEENQVVVLMRYRCGHMALGIAPLVPEYDQCKRLGEMHYQDVTASALELQLDDM